MDTQPQANPEQAKRPGNPAWVKGVSGNPAGRIKKGESFRDCLYRLSEVAGEDARTQKERICAKMSELAESGNLAAAAWIVERIEGKAVQAIEHSQKNDLLRGLTDGEVADLIEAIKRKGQAALDNNGNHGT